MAILDLAEALDILVSELPEALAFYHFGSTATKSANAASDVDLAVLCERPLDPIRLFEARERCARVLSRDVDLVELLTCSTVFAKQVVSEGTLVRAIDAYAAAAFETRTYSAYASLNEERREILEDIKRRGRIGV